MSAGGSERKTCRQVSARADCTTDLYNTQCKPIISIKKIMNSNSVETVVRPENVPIGSDVS